MKTMKNAYKGCLAFTGAVLLGLAGCASTGEKSGAYVDDSVITTKVKSEMTTDNDVKAHNINVKTNRGVVTLTGTAATMQESNKAAALARGVTGVKSVENDIRVQ
jgi:osmotically-inducible protein OsmY